MYEYHIFTGCNFTKSKLTHHYLQALHQAQQLGVLKSNVRSRFVYYVSDLPLKAASGASLASKMTLAEGVPSLYAITRHVLHRIMDHDMNKAVNIIDASVVAEERVVMNGENGNGEKMMNGEMMNGEINFPRGVEGLSDKESLNGEAAQRHWRTVNHVMRAVQRTTVATKKSNV
jgi:hypothetical protein